MVMCFAPGCKHYSDTKTCRFFRFPIKDPFLLKKWIAFIRRDDKLPSMNSLKRRNKTHKENVAEINLETLATASDLLVRPSTSAEGQAESQTSSRPQSSASSGTLPEKLEKLSIVSGGAQQQAELYFLRKESEELKNKLGQLSKSFSFEQVEGNDHLINMYTGIPNAYLFEALYGLFENINLHYVMGWTVGSIPKKTNFSLL